MADRDYRKIALDTLKFLTTTPFGAVLSALALALFAGWVFKTQICLGPFRCFGFSGVVAAVEEPSFRAYRSEAKNLTVDDTQVIQHDLNAVPDIIQVWSSKNEGGPWEQVDSVLADGNDAEGVWITEVSDNSFRFVTGIVAPHSTHGNGNDRNAWEYYGTAKGDDYDPSKVWFRFTALAFCIDGSDCNE